MKKTISMLALILLFLVALDLGVAVVLNWAQTHGRLGRVMPNFEYGYSIPGRLARWASGAETVANLYDLSWRPDILEASAAEFANEANNTGPVVRSYGMSFVNNIIGAAKEQRPSLLWDPHAGPAAPPNFTYALFQEDRGNRRPGDIVVLGILSSAVPGMAALSNRTWFFEQPAPFTYPIFEPDGGKIMQIEPLVGSLQEQRALTTSAEAAQAWAAQLSAEDAFYSPVTFGAVWLDISPFARLIRRSLASRHVTRTKADILSDGTYPYVEVLQLMIGEFARTARADGQYPIVMLVQSGDLSDADVLAIAKPVLERDQIPFLATAEHIDLRDSAAFIPDGHYSPAEDLGLGRAFLSMIGG